MKLTAKEMLEGLCAHVPKDEIGEKKDGIAKKLGCTRRAIDMYLSGERLHPRQAIMKPLTRLHAKECGK